MLDAFSIFELTVFQSSCYRFKRAGRELSISGCLGFRDKSTKFGRCQEGLETMLGASRVAPLMSVRVTCIDNRRFCITIQLVLRLVLCVPGKRSPTFIVVRIFSNQESTILRFSYNLRSLHVDGPSSPERWMAENPDQQSNRHHVFRLANAYRPALPIPPPGRPPHVESNCTPSFHLLAERSVVWSWMDGAMASVPFELYLSSAQLAMSGLYMFRMAGFISITIPHRVKPRR